MQCAICGAAMGESGDPVTCEMPHRGCPFFGEGPEPNCYACKGTGCVIGFNMDGERCPCLDTQEEP